jgi:hypothetical protein
MVRGGVADWHSSTKPQAGTECITCSRLNYQALSYRIWASAASSVLHNLATSGHLVFSRTALFTSPILHLSGYPGYKMSAPSITNYIVKRPWLKRAMTPLANWYTDAAGYRKLGLK